jgi:hypothetical protein
LVFHLDSLYPLLYRLEERGWIKGTWVEKAGERQRRFYRLTPTGQRVLVRQRQTWDEFVEAQRSGFACCSISRIGSCRTLISGRSCARCRQASGT